MIIIIDGYNFLNYINKTNFIVEAQKKKFYEKLKKYKQEKKHEIIIVFDGGTYFRSLVETMAWGKIVYSGQMQSADDVIKNYIDELQQKDLIIVSADREICDYANKLGVCCVLPKYFNKKLKEYPKINFYKSVDSKAIKLNSKLASDELDQLMQEASKMLFFKDESELEKELKILDEAECYGKNSKSANKHKRLLKRL